MITLVAVVILVLGFYGGPVLRYLDMKPRSYDLFQVISGTIILVFLAGLRAGSFAFVENSDGLAQTITYVAAVIMLAKIVGYYLENRWWIPMRIRRRLHKIRTQRRVYRLIAQFDPPGEFQDEIDYIKLIGLRMIPHFEDELASAFTELVDLDMQLRECGDREVEDLQMKYAWAKWRTQHAEVNLKACRDVLDKIRAFFDESPGDCSVYFAVEELLRSFARKMDDKIIPISPDDRLHTTR